jgi:hypothetical protein
MGRFRTLVALVVALTLIVAAPATAFPISGRQTIVNESAGKYRMSGGLRGKWKVTQFKVLDEGPVFKGKGKERFKGCLNRNHDRSCQGDPKGTLKFKFHYWARFASDGSVQLGTCAHAVDRGRGDFDNATGFLMMVDTPTPRAPFVKTHYQGVIHLSRHESSRKVAEQAGPPRPC